MSGKHVLAALAADSFTVMVGHRPGPTFEHQSLDVYCKRDAPSTAGFFFGFNVTDPKWRHTITQASDECSVNPQNDWMVFFFLKEKDISGKPEATQTAHAYVLDKKWIARVGQEVALMHTKAVDEAVTSGNIITRMLHTTGRFIRPTRYLKFDVDVDVAMQAGAACEVTVLPNKPFRVPLYTHTKVSSEFKKEDLIDIKSLVDGAAAATAATTATSPLLSDGSMHSAKSTTWHNLIPKLQTKEQLTSWYKWAKTVGKPVRLEKDGSTNLDLWAAMAEEHYRVQTARHGWKERAFWGGMEVSSSILINLAFGLME